MEISEEEIEAQVHRVGRERNRHWDDPEKGWESFSPYLQNSLRVEARKSLERLAGRSDWLQNRTEDPTKLSASTAGGAQAKFLYGRIAADKMWYP